jgi:NADP-dependent 3-hydroxy acid dehydrogenase YdfG
MISGWLDFGALLTQKQKDIDILVNAAGITHSSLLVVTKPELLEEVINTNLKGTMWGCQTIAKSMMRRKSGSSFPSL